MWENISYVVSLKLYKISSHIFLQKTKQWNYVNHTTVYLTPMYAYCLTLKNAYFKPSA